MTDHDDLYNLKIDAYTPDSLPMARLAEYLKCYADLLGEENCVHFGGIFPGSVQLHCNVQKESSFLVRTHVMEAPHGDRRLPHVRAFHRLYDMLMENSANAALFCNAQPVLELHARSEILFPVIGPFTQAISRQGILIRIGGKDRTAHATIEDGDGILWSFAVSRHLAKRLAEHLFGHPIRLIGHGRCYRDAVGIWRHKSLKADDFEVLSNESLKEAVTRIREISAGAWHRNSIDLMRQLREDDSEE